MTAHKPARTCAVTDRASSLPHNSQSPRDGFIHSGTILLQDRFLRNKIQKTGQAGAVFNLSPKNPLKMNHRVHRLIAALMRASLKKTRPEKKSSCRRLEGGEMDTLLRNQKGFFRQNVVGFLTCQRGVMTKEPTHLAAGNELKSGILPCGVIPETVSGEVQQFVIRLENQDACRRFAPGSKGL